MIAWLKEQESTNKARANPMLQGPQPKAATPELEHYTSFQLEIFVFLDYIAMTLRGVLPSQLAYWFSGGLHFVPTIRGSRIERESGPGAWISAIFPLSSNHRRSFDMILID